MIRFGLGTAQFGLDYGVSNRRGQCPPGEARKILRQAAKSGFDVLDTAAAYGSSEATLGRILEPGHGFDIVTKTPPLESHRGTQTAAEHLTRAFTHSLVRLRQKSVHGLLVHNADDLLGPEGGAIWSAMEGLRERGRVSRIGASVYGPDEADALLARFPLQIIQTPFNVFDQRLTASGCLGRLKRRGVEVHVRSAFLQGLLLMPPEETPDHLAPARPPLRDWRTAMAALGLSPLEGAIGFLRQTPAIDAVVLGVTCRDELLEIARALEVTIPPGIGWTQFALDEPDIIDPRYWPPAPGAASSTENAA